METWLRCAIAPGQFTGEYAVTGQQYDGKIFSFFAPEEYVVPAANGNGWISVEPGERKGQLVVVRLPRESFESGRYVTVRIDQLKQATQGQIVP